MDIERLLETAIAFFSTHILLSLVLIVVLAVILYKKPQKAGKILVFALVILTFLYVGFQMQDAVFKGVDNKENIIEKQRDY